MTTSSPSKFSNPFVTCEETVKTFFVSDTHFNHANILKYCSRPWETVDEMNEGLIKNWNETVSPDDVVYHLGDFAMGNRTLIPEILSRLNGRLILVRGNHDFSKSLGYFGEVHDSLVLELDGHRFELAHNPGHLKQDCDFAMCGHVHEQWVKREIGEIIEADSVSDRAYRHPEIRPAVPVYNVGVDVRGYRPQTLQEILNG
jgi:calcineurin-like phosphoesterase family protein